MSLIETLRKVSEGKGVVKLLSKGKGKSHPVKLLPFKTFSNRPLP